MMLPLVCVVVLALLPAASDSSKKQPHLQLTPDSAGPDAAHSTNSRFLERKLCNSSMNLNDTVVSLEPSRSHTFNGSHINCIIKNVHNFSLTSSNNSETATIICKGSVGLSFINSKNIVISNIAFINCGGRLDGVAIAAINMGDSVSSVERSKVFNNHTYVNLLFNECQNVILHKVSVLQYKGYGILAINVESFIEFDRVVISKSSDNRLLKHAFDYKVSSNTSVVLYFDNCIEYNSTNITISNSVFSINTPMNNTHDDGHGESALTMQKATSGLTTILALEKLCLSVKLFVYNTRFESNSGISTSVYVNGGKFSVIFERCSFRNNTGLGACIVINGASNHIDLTFNNCLFKNNSNIGKGGALAITIQDSKSCAIRLSNYSCELNTAGLNGDCAYIHCIGEHCMDSVKVSLDDVSAYLNGNYNSFPKGLFAFQKVVAYLNCMSIDGCVFKDNIGSSLFGYHSDIYLRGNASFVNNQAFSGSALYFINSIIYFNMKQLPDFHFIGNTAETVGGAIYIAHKTTTKQCSLQFIFEKKFFFTSETQSLNAILHFEGNNALLEAKTVFAYPAYICNQLKSSNFIIDSIQLPQFYSEVFDMPHNDSVLSMPDTVRLCGDVSDKGISIFPGRPFQLELILLDANNNSVYGDVYLIFNNSWTIQHDQYVQQILPDGKCNIIRLTIFSYETQLNGTLTIQVKDSTVNTKVQIFMDDCPYGLIKINNACVCHPLLIKYKAKCDSEAGLITAPFDTWIGVTNDKQLIVSTVCQIDYCYHYTASDSTKVVIPIGELSSCVGHREGIMCGKCKPGYSNVFGVASCHVCSNYFIFTILGDILVGIVLIFSLFKLKISISTGWFNAIILYCNAISLVVGIFSIDDVPVHAIPLLVWLNLLNLELSFPLCFYNSMNEIAKSLLGFAFPAYLILLVIVFIILSRYSTRVSRMTSHYSVQVLATLIFLSYTSIVINAARILEYIKIETENGSTMYMWYQDANVRYFKDIGHCILGAIALAILLLVVIPYTIMLTFSPFMYRYKWVNRVRPFLDAHYGLYKDRYQWWFGLRLWIIFFMAILSITSFHHHNVYYGLVINTFLFLFATAQAYLKPFKNKYVNMIEIAVMADLIIGGMVALTSYKSDFPLKSRPSSHIAILGASVAILFALFWAIIVWHIFKACQFNNPFKRKAIINMKIFSQATANGEGNSTDDTTRRISSNDEHSFKDYGSCGYREPLLSDSHYKN